MLTHLGNIADVAAVVVPFFLWLYAWTRKLETTVGLAKQTSEKHLPYIYDRLGIHDEALLMRTPEHPIIGLVNGAK